ncbi:MAG: ribosome maturation factor RimP [Bordetella sp.]|nr:MAG: ribosome maturation factor RimP [Bordetella sp.]
MNDLFSLISEALYGTGINVVNVEYAISGLLQVTIDRIGGVTIEDCEKINRQLSRVLQVENIDFKSFEVTSPGIDRPLRNTSDFLNALGRRIKISLNQAIDGKKEFSGIIQRMDNFSYNESGQVCENTKPKFCLHITGKKGSIQIMEFTIDKIDHAKLDPILNFKGKNR